MSRGTAERIQIPGVEHLAQLIHSLNSDEAIALGSLRAGLPHKVGIVTRRAINGASQTWLIARTAENIVFKSGHPGFALLDFDTKGMAADVAERLARRVVSGQRCYPFLGPAARQHRLILFYDAHEALWA